MASITRLASTTIGDRSDLSTRSLYGMQFPKFRLIRHQEELEALLAADRDETPDAKSLAVLVPALQKTLDRQFGALEATDRKASVLLGAILGIGVLNANRLQAPPMPSLIPFIIAVGFSLGAILASLVVLWSRSLLTGPNVIRAAQATGWAEVPFTQSVADSLAVAAQENAEVNVVKANWLNAAFTAATIAVVAFAVLGLMGGGTVSQDQSPGSSPAPAAAPASAEPKQHVPPTSTDAPASTPPAPSAGAFVHPRLGVAELREGWDPKAVPAPEAPPPNNRDHIG